MPELLFAFVDDSQLVIHLAQPAPAPDRPWAASEDGLAWTLHADELVPAGTGAPSPYPYLWSLPMRTLDPRLRDLRAVLTGSNPPTWFVEATFINAWSELGTRPIERSLIRKYDFVGTACDRYRVYHLNTVDPVELDVDCTTPFRTIWGD